jgi:hypothetical protein
LARVKITPEVGEEVVRLRREGLAYGEIGARLNLCTESVGKFLRRSGRGRNVRPQGSPAEHKWCRSCGATLPVTQFYRNSGNRDGLQTNCKACAKRRLLELRAAEKNRAKSYGLTLEEFDALKSAAKFCPLCGGPEPNHLDHDHACCPGKTSCGKCVRGYLCRSCNWMLGNASDNIEVLSRAIDWVKNGGPANA